MHICTIRSRVVKNSRNAEVGYFTSEVAVDMKAAAASGDPQGFVQHQIAQALALAVRTTGIPLKEKMWILEFGRFAQINFNYPTGVVV